MKALQHSKEMIQVDESDEIALRNYLSEFNEKVWPIYQRYGFPKHAALIDHSLDQMRGRLERIVTLLEEPEDTL